MRTGFTLAIACFISLVPVFLAAQTPTAVLTQHNDEGRTGWVYTEQLLHHENVNAGSFGLVGSLAVDDQLYAQPLICPNLQVNAFKGAVLFAATVNNTVYAFNADDVSKPAPLWQLNLNPPGQRTPDIADLKDAAAGMPCGGNYRDFSGKIGIVGTPVIDTVAHTLYVVSKSIDASGNFYAYLNALDILTGNHKNGSPVLIAATTTGTGEGAVNNVVAFQAKFQNQRPALLLYQGTVYIAFASYCDWGPYHGWILGYDAQSLTLKHRYNTTPNGWAGGIWMAGQGISVGADGNLYVVTGNGTTDPDNSNAAVGRSESLIKLSPQLQVLDWFTPGNYQYLDDLDLDYGSDGVLMVPNSSLTVSGSKEGISYVVDYNHMGRYQSDNHQVIDTLEFNPGRQGYVHVHGSPIFGSLSSGRFVYAWAETYKIRQFSLPSLSGPFDQEFLEGNRVLDNGMPGAMLAGSSNGADTSSAIIWASFPTSGNANNQVRPGTLAAIRANDVSRPELWNSDLDPNDRVGKFAKFNTPTVANGKVYLPTFSNRINVYGLKCSSVSPTGNGRGLKGEYFTAADPTRADPGNADLIRLDAGINFNWSTDGPAQGISSRQFRVRWTGNLLPLTDETYTILLSATDRVRLKINHELVIDSWNDQPMTTHLATVALKKNLQYAIELEYYAAGNPAACYLQWSSPSICPQMIPATQLLVEPVSCGLSGSGLTAEYYSNLGPLAPLPVVPTVIKTEPAINFNWGGTAPQGISADHFRARYSGFVQTQDSGNYVFTITGDDGIKLWVNGQLLINQWVDQGATAYSATISLPKCTQVPIRIEYYENGGDALCTLEWTTPLGAQEIIPTKQLFPQPGQENPQLFFLFPNPADQRLSISLKTGLQVGDRVSVYDMLGRQVGHFTVQGNIASNIFTIPVAQLPRGLYTIQLITSEKPYQARFLKK